MKLTDIFNEKKDKKINFKDRILCSRCEIAGDQDVVFFIKNKWVCHWCLTQEEKDNIIL